MVFPVCHWLEETARSSEGPGMVRVVPCSGPAGASPPGGTSVVLRSTQSHPASAVQLSHNSGIGAWGFQWVAAWRAFFSLISL